MNFASFLKSDEEFIEEIKAADLTAEFWTGLCVLPSTKRGQYAYTTKIVLIEGAGVSYTVIESSFPASEAITIVNIELSNLKLVEILKKAQDRYYNLRSIGERTRVLFSLS